MGSAQADPGYYLLRPYEQAGHGTVELRYWSVKADAGGPATLWPELGASYGLSRRWTTRLLASFIGTADSAVKLSTLNWQNDWLLSAADSDHELALHTQYISERGYDGGFALEIGPVFQTEFGLTRLNLNLLLSREYNEDAAASTQLKYQWQVSRPLGPGWRLGLQGFGELGNWLHWAPHKRQSHRAGPSFQRDWQLANGQGLSLQAALLFGSTYTQNGKMFSAQLQWSY
ncbi:hypothetical protein RQP53_22360 [Paucibacter sp. APW11]|uniref:Uncharacterized protein n=1 Tax=Roseateles aquae TaxID=3077235 RepID=A0ABU3PIU8_9BURK|nr:hypothetical protein [Paucibacter sp. APW11]MDT9002038.1 hypothetical protein [Paucibacter sp. APW11]